MLVVCINGLESACSVIAQNDSRICVFCKIYIYALTCFEIVKIYVYCTAVFIKNSAKICAYLAVSVVRIAFFDMICYVAYFLLKHRNIATEVIGIILYSGSCVAACYNGNALFVNALKIFL